MHTHKPMTTRRKRRRRRSKRRTAQPSRVTRPSAPEQSWSRAGAHNIAGVSFQVAVTARLLLHARAGELPLVRATPEGFEDIDLQFCDGTRALVQVKERSPTTGFTRSDLADALRKKARVLADDGRCRFILATNAMLGGGLSPTGWDQPLSQCVAEDQIAHLTRLLKRAFEAPSEILSRTHIVQIEGSVVESTRRDFACLLGIEPCVAMLAYARLVERITEIAVRQRSATPDTAEWIAPSDLDALVARVVETVNVDSLDEAVRVGIVEPVDFSVRADLSVADFLSGVDVLPAHIAADLDLPRPVEVQALIAALREHHSALLTGPSGAGKSALMWRTARELAGQARPYRVLRLFPDDVSTLARWIRLQEPSQHFPLLLCADNLGRPGSEGWTALAREFIDRPGLLLLGACRDEDYHPGLVVGRTTIVDPKLDRELAVSIAKALANRDIQTVLDVDEAFEASDGLLMEFLSMLLTGRRLRQVVEQQVAARMVAERKIERDILRYVATAHSAGAALPAAVLGTLLPDQDLAPALARLDREHILVADDRNRWMGLHELRSEVARDYLHRFPPPTMAITIRHLVEHLPVSDACRIIEVYARLDADLVPATETVSAILRGSDISAAEGAQLVSSLAMADAFRHARACLRAIEGRRPNSLDPETVLFLSYGHRFAGVSLDNLTHIHPNFARVTELAAALPARPSSLRDICLRNLSGEAARSIALRATADQAATWLESLEGCVTAQLVTVREIWTHFSEAPLDVAARLVATLRSLAAVDDAEQADQIFSGLQDRIHHLAADLADCIGVETKDELDGRVVSVRLLVPEDDATLNERSVATCRLIFDLCPEADIAEVIVLTPDGDRYSVDGLEPGYKRIPRTNLPRRPETIENVNFRRAARSLQASRYWTEPLRLLADTSMGLVALWEDAVAWLINPHHHARRRREAIALTAALAGRLAIGPKEPVSEGAADDRSVAFEAISEAVSVVRDVAAMQTPDDQKKRNVAVRCTQAVKRLMSARQGGLPRLSSLGDPLPESLDAMLTLLANILFVHASYPAHATSSLRKHATESWVDVGRRLVDGVVASGYEAERAALEKALGTPHTNWGLHRIEHRDMVSAPLLTDRWVILIPADSDDPALLAFADRLEPGVRQHVAFRAFVVWSAAGRVLPLNAVELGASQFYPADEDDLLMIASGLGTEVMKSVHLKVWDSFITELVRASRSATLLRLRRQTGLADNIGAFETRYASASSAAKGCHPLLRTEADLLLDRVAREPDGGQGTLASEIYRSLTHGEDSDDIVLLAALRFAALSIDL